MTTGRRRRRDGGSEVLRDLEREGPDAARAAWDEDAHAFLDRELVAKRWKRRERHGRSLGEVQRGRLPGNQVFVDARCLGEGAEAILCDARENLVARAKPPESSLPKTIGSAYRVITRS